jgi:hypothetical protein
MAQIVHSPRLSLVLIKQDNYTICVNRVQTKLYLAKNRRTRMLQEE